MLPGGEDDEQEAYLRDTDTKGKKERTAEQKRPMTMWAYRFLLFFGNF